IPAERPCWASPALPSAFAFASTRVSEPPPPEFAFTTTSKLTPKSTPLTTELTPWICTRDADWAKPLGPEVNWNVLTLIAEPAGEESASAADGTTPPTSFSTPSVVPLEASTWYVETGICAPYTAPGRDDVTVFSTTRTM